MLTRTRLADARSADARLLRLLAAQPLQGRLHSLFDRAVNIETEAGGILTLACRTLDNAPATLVVDLASFGRLDLAVGDPVRGCGRALLAGSALEIRLEGCKAWDQGLPVFPSDCHALPERLRAGWALLEREGAGAGMAARREGGTAFDLAVEAALAQGSSALLEALAQADFASARCHAASMMGLGPGLTPSGDDFLLGLFAVLNIPASPCEGWLGGGNEVLAEAAHRTNAISATALHHAAGGHVRESVLDLVTHLLLGPEDRLAASMRRVLAIGSTSGSDIACGLLAGLDLNLKHIHSGGNASCRPRS